MILQDLLSEYISTQGTGGSRSLENSLDTISNKTRDLRRQLRKAVVDHVSDSFLETGAPLAVLISAALEGGEREVEEASQMFSEHAAKLVEVANLACSMSGSEEGVKMVRHAALQIGNLCPQVINAARILSNRPKSKVALENMEVFKLAWEQQLQLLTDAVDDIVTVEDFLAVSENHILEDVNRCCLALQEKDSGTLESVAASIRGRSWRISDVVTAEMDNFQPGIYTERVMEAVRLLQSDVIPNFSSHVSGAVTSLADSKAVDENEFIDASRLVYDGVREIRRAVLLNREEEDLDSDTEWEETGDVSEVGSVRPQVESRTDSMIDEYPDISGEATARKVNFSFIITEECTNAAISSSHSTPVPVTFCPIQLTFIESIS